MSIDYDQLDQLIKFVKRKKDCKQADVAIQVNMHPSNFSADKKDKPDEVYNRLLEYFPVEVAAFHKHYEAKKKMDPALDQNDVKEEQAMLKALLIDYAKLKAHVLGITVAEVMDEINQNTKLISRHL